MFSVKNIDCNTSGGLEMLKKIVLLFCVLSFAAMFCIAEEPYTEMQQYTAKFEQLKAKMTPTMKTKFDSLFMQFIPKMKTGVITEQLMQSELNRVFTGNFGNFTEKSAMFYFGYAMYFQNMEMQGKVQPGQHGHVGVRPMITKITEQEGQNLGSSSQVLKDTVQKYWEGLDSITPIQE